MTNRETPASPTPATDRHVAEPIGHDALDRPEIGRGEAPCRPSGKPERPLGPLQIQASAGSAPISEHYQRLQHPARHAHGRHAPARRKGVRDPIQAGGMRRLGHRPVHVSRQGVEKFAMPGKRHQPSEALGLARRRFGKAGRFKDARPGRARPGKRQHEAFAQIEHLVGIAAGPAAFQFVAEPMDWLH